MPCPTEVAGLAVESMSGDVHQGGEYDGKVRGDCWYGDDRRLWLRVWWTATDGEPEELLHCGGSRGFGLREEDVQSDGTVTGVVRHPSHSVEIEHLIDPGVTVDREAVWAVTTRLLDEIAPYAHICPGAEVAPTTSPTGTTAIPAPPTTVTDTSVTAPPTTVTPETSVTIPDFAGAEIRILGPALGGEEDALNAVLDSYFNEPTGARASYDADPGFASVDFQSRLLEDIAAGRPPDVMLFWGPDDFMEEIAQLSGVPLEDLGLDLDDLSVALGDYLLGLGEVGGRPTGIPFSLGLPGLVWFHQTTFAAEGYQVPDSWDELVALSSRMVADGYTPWCMAAGPEFFAGVPATRWLEDVLLRSAGAAVFDQWGNHEIPFDDQAVVRAAGRLGEIVFGDGFVLGGARSIPDQDWFEQVQPMFADPPGCLMVIQGTTATLRFPEGTILGEDVGVFALPGFGPNRRGTVVDASYAVALADRPEVRALMEVLASPGFQCSLGGDPGYHSASPHRDVGPSCYTSPAAAISTEAVRAAMATDALRLGASDQVLPVEVGWGTFPEAMAAWLRGRPISQVLAEVEASWPGG
jgi:alpha-glucoside transport system substrate-binding protein